MSKTTAENNQPRRVLIVEDEGDMCLLLNIILTGKNLELDHVKNLKAAAEYLQQEQPSVVILDNKLPDGFGIDYIPVLKKAYPSLKVIMISGYDGAAKDVALENGADAYLEKPFKREQLFNAIMDQLNAPIPA
jgi:two-component system, OmpR family, response regulator